MHCRTVLYWVKRKTHEYKEHLHQNSLEAFVFIYLESKFKLNGTSLMSAQPHPPQNPSRASQNDVSSLHDASQAPTDSWLLRERGSPLRHATNHKPLHNSFRTKNRIDVSGTGGFSINFSNYKFSTHISSTNKDTTYKRPNPAPSNCLRLTCLKWTQRRESCFCRSQHHGSCFAPIISSKTLR